MLLALLAVITLYTVSLYACKRDSGELLRMLFTLSLGIFWFGILTYIAKKGGYGKEFIPILYGGGAIYQKLQYLRLTLGQLGYTVAVGRYLFPFLFMLVALHASNFIPTEHLKWYYLAASLLPIVSLVIYIPSVFETLIEPYEVRLRLSVTLSYSWIIAYLLVGWACLLKETFSITVRFFRSRFLQNLAFYASTTLLYAMYCKQDPAQIYLFYRNDYMWMLGLWYLNKGFRPILYSLVWMVTVLSCIISLLSLVGTAHITWNEQHEQALLERKGNEMQPGINIFTHGLKNQLLANQIVIEKIAGQNIPSQKSLVSSLKANNQLMLQRIEKLYAFSRQGTIHLVPMSIEPVIGLAREKFLAKYPQGLVDVRLTSRTGQILADKEYLSEAFANIMENGWEATLQAGRATPVAVKLFQERLWVSVTISDNGNGIPKKVGKHIYEPFYSSKNSATNWGFGMYFTHQVIKNHLGSIRFDSSPKGTSFLILLPIARRKARV